MQENHLEKSKHSKGLKVKSVANSSPFYLSGIKKGDIITAVNGQSVTDELDFHFYTADFSFDVEFVRNEQVKRVAVTRTEGSFSEIDFYENPINCCRNKCIFCFIDQMPRGLRKGLYIKDEDFKHSFLNGNYVTLTGSKQSDLEKIVQIGLSPLYISVHTTNDAVRKKMLGITRAPDIMEQLRYLADNNIAFHTQIVLCPGHNDGEILRQTIDDLFSFGESLLSIAVVPVGLTRHRKVPLAPVTKESAQAVCMMVSALSDTHYAADNVRRLFLSDEFFIRAEIGLPPCKYYEEYPQIENGVGLVRQLIDKWGKYKREFAALSFTPVKKHKSHLVITSRSAELFIKHILTDAKNANPSYPVEFIVAPVTNRFFGEMVTVAGLMTAKDVILTIKAVGKEFPFDKVILPRIMFNYAVKTLDGYSPERISKIIGVPVIVAETIDDLLTSGVRGLRAGK